MARSSTVWAAVLLLASFSGSGPLLTTAEAMPAPGPKQTQGRPMYYFPRHVKRAIVTNHTEPAAPSPTPASPPKSSSSDTPQPHLIPDLTSFINPLIVHSEPQVPSSSAPASSKKADPTSEVPSTQGAATPLPQSSSERLGVSSQAQDPPAPVSSPSSLPPDNLPLLKSSAPLAVSSSDRNPEVVLTSSFRTLASRSEINTPAQGSTGGSSETIVPPTSAAPSSAPVKSSNDGLLSSVLAPLVGSTGVLPLPAVQPTSSAQDLVSRSLVNTPVKGSTGTFLDLTGSATTAAPSSAPSQPSNGGLLSSVLAPLVGSTGAVPVPVVQPSSAVSSPNAAASSPALNAPVSSPAPNAPVSSPAPNAAVSSSPASSVVGPFIVPGSTAPVASPTVIASTGVVPSSVVQPSSAPAAVSQEPQLSSQASGIVVGLTTAFTPTAPGSVQATPTSNPALLGVPNLLSSVLSELPSIVPSIVPSSAGVSPSASVGPVTAAPSPTPVPSGILPPVLSSLVSNLPGILSSAVSEVPPSALPSLISQIISNMPTASGPVSVLPTPTGPAILSSVPIVGPSGSAPVIVSSMPSIPPTSEIVLPSGTAPISVTPPVITPTVTPSGVLPSSGLVGSAGSSGVVMPTQPASLSSIPVSEVPPSSVSLGSQSSVAVSANPVSAIPSSAATPTAPPASDSATLTIPSIPSVTKQPSPVFSLAATATDSRTAMAPISSIIQAQSPTVAPSVTPSAIPSSLPKLIAPPGGSPTDVPQDTFMGQICFNYKLNYEFVSSNDGGNQIFHYLPIAIANALNINVSQVTNYGLKAYDTLKYQGFITTISLFTIPKDLESTLAAQLHNPMDALWHNTDPVVNDLTSLINTACPLPAGRTPDSTTPNQVAAPVNPSSVGNGDGSAIGGDIAASRKVNSTSAIVASSAIVGAFAYGAAMFFVARRYRNKRNAHQRTSSIPSMRRNTYGSIPGGAAAWMHGARNGRMTPGSRGSHGSDSTQGHSIRTQQISAPVNAENSLGWN